MSAQELGGRLCGEGDRHLALGEPLLATAFYLAAFSCHAPSALRSARAALAGARGAPVVATLEAWCRGESQIPAVHWDGMAVVSLTGTLASAFLATLCPGHPAAVLHSLAGLLARGRHGEVVRRCGALLDAHSQQALELRLTRALAWILSGAQVDAGLADYLQAFASTADRTVAFTLTHQQPYLPVLVSILQGHISRRQQAGDSASQQEADCQRLLAALDPGGTWGNTLSPEVLLRGGRYEDCQAACSRALESDPTGSRSQGERLAALLVTRAAAAFFLDRGAQDLLRDLHEAFRESPSAARRQFEAVLSAGDRERVLAQVQEAADVGFAHFQEAVRSRPELRQDSGRELLAPRRPDRGPAGARGRRSQAAETDGSAAQEGDAQGVYQLATLLMELDAEDEASRLLAADALYRLGRLDEAHKALLVALSRRPQAAPVLVRLALLQLRRGFFYDANQLAKKVVQSGDTACLQPTLDVFRREDRELLRGHCHARAVAILRAQPGGAEGEAHTREAIAYLSLAIFAAGRQASESLLTRARCYAVLGQRKTALFDFNSALRAEPGNVQALCGRALLHLALDQQKEAVDDILSALKLDPRTAVPEIRSLKPEAQALITQVLSSGCRALLSQLLDTGAPLSDRDVQGLLAAGEALIKLDAGQLSGHILLVDVLTAMGNYEEAGAHLQEALRPTPPSEVAQARRGLLGLKKGDVPAAARDLQCLVETDSGDLGFLLRLLEASERQSLAQAAAQEASALLTSGQPRQALGYCSLAVLAGGRSACHLRLRATCLAQLQEFSRALRDLDLLLREGAGDGDLPMRAEDLCSRGRLLLSLGNKAGAAGAFAQALKLAPAPAQSSLWQRPGRTPTAQVLLSHGQRCLEDRLYSEAWTAAESGLLVDPEHCGLRKLKARVRREAASGCRLH
ncbi:PREDICTED: tetratricopeptide repeat protein 34 [Miniopterus natalensis]|uniref:tetratricopeptide repeat protein 34 n=1 Tax=Miniopterus natalensis TaxID=291302 RepID=UPI0007A72835|nr:PREDICTED: tetratricopeptide repeat protein 34 [Miniopterus natalensis]